MLDWKEQKTNGVITNHVCETPFGNLAVSINIFSKELSQRRASPKERGKGYHYPFRSQVLGNKPITGYRFVGRILGKTEVYANTVELCKKLVENKYKVLLHLAAKQIECSVEKLPE